MSWLAAWAPVIPALLLIAALLLVPGYLIARAGRLGHLDALGVAPMLSLSVAALAIWGTTRLHRPWGLGPVLLVTLVLFAVVALLALVAVWLAPRVHLRLPGTRPERPEPAQPLGWRRLLLHTAVIVGPGAAAATWAARGMASPARVNQTFDAVFHYNAVNLVVERHSADPAIFSLLSDPSSPPSGFYPPVFHAIAALGVMDGGAQVVQAANATAVLITLIWPIGVSLLVRSLTGRSLLALTIGSASAALVGLFPTTLLTFGVLWPNALSLVALPGMLALTVRVLGIDRMVKAPPGAFRADSNLAWWQAAAVLVLALPGVYYTHPGTAFALLFLAVPVVVAAAFVRLPRRDGLLDLRWTALVVVLLVAAFTLLWRLLDFIPGLETVRVFDWPARERISQGIGEGLLLASPLSKAPWAFALLAIIGIGVVLVRSRWHWWLVAGHALIVWLAVLAAAVDSEFSQQLTGFWYNDAYRIFAFLATTAAPLAAIGAVALRDAIAIRLTGWVATVRAAPWRPSAARLRLLGSVVLAALILLLQPGFLGFGANAYSIARNYPPDPPADQIPEPDENGVTGYLLTTGPEVQMFRRLAHEVPAGMAIAGNPWEGEVYAGLFSGHPVIWPFLRPKDDDDRQLLRHRFRDFTTDPAVCAAVHRLKVAVVVGDSQIFWRNLDRDAHYLGFDDLDSAPGLTLIDEGGTARAYRVGACRS